MSASRAGAARLELARDAILAHRRRVGTLDARLPWSAKAVRSAAWAGLTDSMPRAALLALHARVAGTKPTSWEDPSLVQLWGLRFSAYAVPAQDVAPFSLGRLSDEPAKRRFAQDTADAIERFLDGRRLDAVTVGRGLKRHPNSLRYAAPTGRVLIRWDGARQPTIWAVPAPAVEPMAARMQLARRYLHVMGPGTDAGFGSWAGIRPAGARVAFEALAGELVAVRTPIGEASILAADEASFRAQPGAAAPARLLPSGDTFWLFQGADRELLVPDAARRGSLWTPRVWPGALLVDGDVAGTWRRAGAEVAVTAWRRLTAAEREAVEVEAAGLPLPDVAGRIRVTWAG